MESTLNKSHHFIDQDIKPRRTKLAGSLAGLVMLSFSAPTLAGWEVQWIDKFEGTGVNWDNWTAQTNANYNAELQCYTDDDSSANKNYDVSNGTLKIIARKQNIACPGLGGQQKTWTSGRLNGKDKSEFLYGRIESRIRFDKLEGGTWPAFWMLENRIGQQPIKGDGDYIGWPNAGAGEIDVWEWFSNEPDSYITNFFNSESCAGEIRYSYPNGGADVQNWHNYAMEWSKDLISFYIDDTLVVSQDMTSCSQYEEPMFVLLNVAMGGMLGGYINPSLTQATMEVDYVAHCTASSGNNASYCNESTPSVAGEPTPTPEPTPGQTPLLTIFAEQVDADWTVYDSSTATTPAVITDASAYGAVTEFIGETSDMALGYATSTPLDMSAYVTSGTLEFDIKVTGLPNNSSASWLLKVEANGGIYDGDETQGSQVEMPISPVLNEWVHVSHSLKDLGNAGLLLTGIDKVMVFPEWTQALGAEYLIDNVVFLENAPTSEPTPTPEPIVPEEPSEPEPEPTDPEEPTEPEQPSTPEPTPAASNSSGGSLSQTLLLCLGLICVFRRQRKGSLV